MAKDVIATSLAARDVFERVDTALGDALSKTISSGPETDLTLTSNAQPAILATSCAILAALRERLPELSAPAFAAGHSLGEYSALVAAGALALEDAARLVRARGLAMQEAVPPGTGAMSAIIGVERDSLQKICAEAACGEVVSAANFNAPGQIVIAGHAGAVARASELAVAAKGRAIPLKVSAPFHCALMAPAARALELELARTPIAAPAFPIVSNVDARPNADPERVRDLLVRQVCGVVRWDDGIQAMVTAGVTHAIEIGPGKVLAGLMKRIAKHVKVLSVGDAKSIDEVAAFVAGSSSASGA